ncbi:MAG: cadmium-translocating P-type ATPase [Rhodoferax sp.]|nr:cadmium-translocating P-type ATPase [Rhodoferax sp.]
MPSLALPLSVLDDPQEWGAFGRADTVDPGVWHSSVVIEGMHCAACAITVEEALSQVPGVQSVRVSAASHRAQVVWSSAATQPSRWMQALQRQGYRLLPANDARATDMRRVETRKALWRWLVAGFCMMQVMMYAYPAYVAQPGDLSREMEQLLRWASWVLTLPVMLFSCGPFLRNALRDIVQRRISMDLPVALGMAITFAVSTAGTFEPQGLFGREVYFDSLTMFVFFLLTGRWLELRLRDRTAGALEALMNRLPDSVERVGPDGSYERVAVRRLVVGDRMRVGPGNAFAADGTIEQGQTQVDEALLTGESQPLQRGPGAPVVAGSHNLSATVVVRVERVGHDTRFSQIVALMESASASRPDAAQLADRLARPFLFAVLLAAGVACAWWWPQDPEHALMVAVAVLVVTCPCALSLATPAALLSAAGRLARSAVLVRRLAALEVLAKVDTVVFDKTGTLTRDAFVLTRTTVRSGEMDASALAMASALARHSLHPVSRALCKQASGGDWTCDGVTETPGQGVQAAVRNSKTGLQRNVQLGSAAFCAIEVPIGEGLQVHLSDAQGWLASFQFQEDLRAQAAETVQALGQMGIAVHLLSGDNAASVAQVAAQAGIDHARAECSPDGKLQFLRALQQQDKTVAMVGDGLNDGPVLAGAHVSFAFGKAVPLAQSRSDFVVLGENIHAVADTVVLARRTMRMVRQNLWWALAYNAACVPLAVAGYLPAWLAGLGMASSSLFVVLNALRLARPNAQRPTNTLAEA